MSQTIEIIPNNFPPELESYIAPELSLQKHLSLGSREDLRKPEEFKNVVVSNTLTSRYSVDTEQQLKNDVTNDILGSNIYKSGNTTVITTIRGGIVENNEITDDMFEMPKDTHTDGNVLNYAPVYPQVEVMLGDKFLAPTIEEMIISQKLYEQILHTKLINISSLKTECGVRFSQMHENDQETVLISYPDDENSSKIEFPKKKWSYVLYAKIVILGRNGPIFDKCWNSLVYALQSTRLPRIFVDERGVNLKMSVRTRGRSLTIKETYDVLCDTSKSIPLKINESAIGFASNFGLLDLNPEEVTVEEDNDMKSDIFSKSILLADLNSGMEEKCIRSTLSITQSTDGHLKQISLVGNGAKITPDSIRRAILLSKDRATDLASINV